MEIKTDVIKQELENLIKYGKETLTDKRKIESAKELVRRGNKDSKTLELSKKHDQTTLNYQKWYTQSLPVVRQLIPERYIEFQDNYRVNNRKAKVIDASIYTISDYLSGLSVTRGGVEVFSSLDVFLSRFAFQIEILESALTRIDSLLVNIKGVLQAELFDNELSVANELLKKGHLRAAGAVAGVVLERHLGQVAAAHSITIQKKDPTIAELNNELKAAGIFDTPNWRFVELLGDIRNLCVHSKGREPKRNEVEDLIQGTEKIIKTVF